ncbi:uncharacterized protein LOC144001641 [Festucalex cinctus]
MAPAVTRQPQDEPTVPVVIEGSEHDFMVDTGATYSCVGSSGLKLPLSGSSIKTIGFSGKTQLIPLTQPIPMLVSGRKVVAPLLISDQTAINLLGRDILCALNANIMCTPDGIWVELPPKDSLPATTLMPLQAPREKQHYATVYSLLLAKTAPLLSDWKLWTEWIQKLLPHASKPSMPEHCTLFFDELQNYKDYEICWKEIMDNNCFYVHIVNIYVGPQGAAAAITLPLRAAIWFQVPNSTPHMTLFVEKGHKSWELGPMVKAALQIIAWKDTDNPRVHISPDKQFIKISFFAVSEGRAVTTLVHRPAFVQASLSAEHESLLGQIPSRLWSQHKTDIGFVKSAQPVVIKLKPNVTLPNKSQYPLKPQAAIGIKPTIEGLIAAGFLVKTQSPCNTPIFPVPKPRSPDYRLVHDLRPINAIVDAETPVVPDPHTLLSNIPPESLWYTVIDLCSAFFSVPVHPASQYLFAFKYEGQQYTYTRLPQGYVDSPTIFNRVLSEDLGHLDVSSTVIQYMDDILVASPTKEYCERDSLTVLLALEKGGHKVSRDKLQFCQKEVDYLGRRLCGNLRKISATHLEAIAKASQPKTVSQMLTFLGMTGYSRAWICDYAIKAAPLREMIRAAGQNNGSANLEWNEKALQGFSMLKPMVDRTLHECIVCAQHNVRKSFSAPLGHIPIPEGPFRHLMMDHIDMIERVIETAEDRQAEIQPDLQRVVPGDWVYVKTFKRRWNDARREGPFKGLLKRNQAWPGVTTPPRREKPGLGRPQQLENPLCSAPLDDPKG